MTNKGWFKKGEPSAFKGRKGKPNSGSFKSGNKPWNAGKEYAQIKGEKHWKWKGDKISYTNLHKWLYDNYKKLDMCEFCGDGGKLECANKSGEYKRDLTDWLTLCVKCHKAYDKGRKSISKRWPKI